MSAVNIKFRPRNTGEKPQMMIDIEMTLPKLKENKDENHVAVVVEMNPKGVWEVHEAIKKFVAMWDAQPQDAEVVADD